MQSLASEGLQCPSHFICCTIWIWIHFFTYGYLIVVPPCVKKTIFSPLNSLHLCQKSGVGLHPSSLFCSIHLLVYIYTKTTLSWRPWLLMKSWHQDVSPLHFVLLPRHLGFPRNFKIGLSTSTEQKPCEVLIKTALHLYLQIYGSTWKEYRDFGPKNVECLSTCLKLFHFFQQRGVMLCSQIFSQI